MIKGHTHRITWGDEVVEIPPLKSTDNGWYYGFMGEVLGRGQEGEEAARKKMDQRISQVLEEHDWKMPDEIFPHASIPYIHRGLLAYVEDEKFGTTGILYDHRVRKMTCYVHPALKEISEARFDSTPDTKEIADFVKPADLAKNIWEYGKRLFPILALMDVPEGEVAWQLDSRNPLRQPDGSFTIAKDSYSYFQTLTEDELEKARASRIKDLIELFRVFDHTDIRILTSYAPRASGYGQQEVVTGVVIKVKDHEHEEEHTVTIQSSGEASVKCGYREDERKYLEYQKRELAGWMQDELATGEFEEITFD